MYSPAEPLLVRCSLTSTPGSEESILNYEISKHYGFAVVLLKFGASHLRNLLTIGF